VCASSFVLQLSAAAHTLLEELGDFFAKAQPQAGGACVCGEMLAGISLCGHTCGS
jgi:hypothetical protein